MAEALIIGGWALPVKAYSELTRAAGGPSAPVLVPHMQELPVPGEESGPSSFARVVRSVAAREPRPVHIIGCSMGGIIGLEVAALFPEIVRSLTVVSGSACFCRRNGYSCGTEETEVRALAAALKRRPVETVASFYRRVFDGAQADRAKDAEQVLAQAPLSAFLAGLSYLRDADLRTLLPRIETRVLVIHGTEDEVIPCAAGEYLSAHLRGSLFKTLPGCGHAAWQKEEAAACVREFLNHD